MYVYLSIHTHHQTRFVGLQARAALKTNKASLEPITKLALLVFRGCQKSAHGRFEKVLFTPLNNNYS